MKLETILKASFIIGLIVVFVGAFLKIMHHPYANPVMITGIIFSLIFVISAIYEVWTSGRINRTEKTIWTVSLVLFGSIAGLIYILVGRKRITAINH